LAKFANLAKSKQNEIDCLTSKIRSLERKNWQLIKKLDEADALKKRSLEDLKKILAADYALFVKAENKAQKKRIISCLRAALKAEKAYWKAT